MYAARARSPACKACRASSKASAAVGTRFSFRFAKTAERRGMARAVRKAAIARRWFSIIMRAPPGCSTRRACWGGPTPQRPAHDRRTDLARRVRPGSLPAPQRPHAVFLRQPEVALRRAGRGRRMRAGRALFAGRGSGGRRRAGRRALAGRGARILRKACPPAAGRKLPRLPRRQARRRTAARLARRNGQGRRQRRGHRRRRSGRQPARQSGPLRRRTENASQGQAPGRGDRQPRNLDQARRPVARGPCRAAHHAHRRRDAQEPLGLPADSRSRAAAGGRSRLAALDGRPVRAGEARSRRHDPLGPGRSPHADSPRSRSTSSACRPRPKRSKPSSAIRARRFRPPRRAVARFAPLRRALGAPLARRGPLRRHQGIRLHRRSQLPERLALSRLGGRRLESRPAVRRVSRAADRRRPPACRAGLAGRDGLPDRRPPLSQ